MRIWASRTQRDSSESQEFSSVVKDFGIKLDDHVRDSAKETIKEIDRVLSQPKFAEINRDFDNCRKRKNDPAWYVPLGQPSFASICRAVGRGSVYALLYSGASEVMHSSNYGHHVKFGDKKLTVEPIRSVEGFENVFRFSLPIALHTFMKILDKYRAGERTAFSRKYLENWRHEFMNFPEIKYQVETMGI